MFRIFRSNACSNDKDIDNDNDCSNKDYSNNNSNKNLNNEFNFDEIELSKSQQRKLKLKLDFFILPILTIDYFWAQLDRQNLSNARLQGLEDVLDKNPTTSDPYGTVTALFYVLYIITQPITALSYKFFTKYIPPKTYIGLTVILFGLVSSLHATAFNFGSLTAARSFLGIFEALFAPSIVYYLTMFYTKTEVTTRVAIWFGVSAIAGAFGGAIAYGVQNINSYVPNWKILFLIEGLPAILCGILTLFIIPDTPQKRIRFLSHDEQLMELKRVRHTLEPSPSINMKHVIQSYTDWRVYWAGAIYFCLNNTLSSTSAFLPTIIKTLGYSNANAQLYTVPVYVVAAFITVSVALASDKAQLRGPFMVVMMCVSVVGYAILLGATNNNNAKYGGVFLVVMGVYPCIAMINGWLVGTNFGSSSKKATALGLFYAIGQCGSVLGSKIFPSSEGPQYTKGYAICLSLMAFGSILSAILSLSYWYDNRRRDKIYGIPGKDQFVDTSELADKAPMFRYVL